MTSGTEIGPALVTGAGRGFGRAVAAALHAGGGPVVAVGRSAPALLRLREELGDRVTIEVADVTDPVVAGELLNRHRPRTLVLNAGAAPLMRPLQHHTWETFSRPWEVDTRQTFNWVREALLLPLAPGATVVAMSSGAALVGSPLSGGYAAAKAGVRLIARYAAEESERLDLGVRFVSVLPGLTPSTDLGASAVAAYAARDGLDVEAYLLRSAPGPPVEVVAAQLVALATGSQPAGAYLLRPDGPAPAP